MPQKPGPSSPLKEPGRPAPIPPQPPPHPQRPPKPQHAQGRAWASGPAALSAPSQKAPPPQNSPWRDDLRVVQHRPRTLTNPPLHNPPKKGARASRPCIPRRRNLTDPRTTRSRGPRPPFARGVLHFYSTGLGRHRVRPRARFLTPPANTPPRPRQAVPSWSPQPQLQMRLPNLKNIATRRALLVRAGSAPAPHQPPPKKSPYLNPPISYLLSPIS
jgi:hypothetical protein